ncbi:Uncharacterised protein [uncultured archaeon]|nr:Uncharacterised protein [uncultured archaeon]
MIDPDIIFAFSGIGELLLLITGIYAISRFFTFGEIGSLILGIFLSVLAIGGIIYWIKKKESFFTQYA